MGGSVRKKIIFDIGLAIECVSDTELDEIDTRRMLVNFCNSLPQSRFAYCSSYLNKIPGKTCGNEFRTETVAALSVSVFSDNVDFTILL